VGNYLMNLNRVETMKTTQQIIKENALILKKELVCINENDLKWYSQDEVKQLKKELENTYKETLNCSDNNDERTIGVNALYIRFVNIFDKVLK
jgi:hypothetical protein